MQRQAERAAAIRGGQAAAQVVAAAPMSEINVTPLVDVMLVLLIVFMVAAPLMTVGVPIELPEDQGQAARSRTEPITVSVDRPTATIYLQETEIELDDTGAEARGHRQERL